MRDPERQANLAILTCKAFASSQPVERQTWQLRLSSSGVQALCEFPVMRLQFGREAFAADPRIASFNWDR